jgi:predicted transcriptional regulator
MFGRAIRLRLLLWVRQNDEAFFQSEAARAIDYSGVSAVAKELDTLEELGMLRKFGRPSKTGRQNYIRIESPLWSVVDVTGQAIGSEGPAQQSTGNAG